MDSHHTLIENIVMLMRDFIHLRKFKDIHKDKETFICCNGPSLNYVPMEKLKDKIVFALNRGYLKEDMPITYLVTADKRIEAAFGEEISRLPLTVFSHRPIKNTIRYKLGVGKFSTDIVQGMKLGHSTTIVALQLAFYMGCNPVYIVGMDHKLDYTKANRVRMEFTNKDKDVNHFTKDYYPENYRYGYQNLLAVANSYKEAKEVYTAHGRELYNASYRTNLSNEIIPRITLWETQQP